MLNKAYEIDGNYGKCQMARRICPRSAEIYKNNKRKCKGCSEHPNI